MITSVSILLLSISIVAIAVMLAVLSRQLRRQSDEITELQAAVDLNAVQHGLPPFFAPRYDLDLERLDDDD